MNAKQRIAGSTLCAVLSYIAMILHLKRRHSFHNYSHRQSYVETFKCNHVLWQMFRTYIVLHKLDTEHTVIFMGCVRCVCNLFSQTPTFYISVLSPLLCKQYLESYCTSTDIISTHKYFTKDVLVMHRHLCVCALQILISAMR